jgi:transcriptional regulator with XRE-family HTH domain
MSEKDAFGPNLRRIRVQHGVSLEAIAESTKVSVDLLEGLERNDFSRWPTGLYARAYVRAYALEIGVDPDGAVDEFCRWYAQGDRRAERVVRDHAAIVGHELQWQDDLVGQVVQIDRRSAAPAPEPETLPALADVRTRHIVAACWDAGVVIGAGLLVALVVPIGAAAAVAATALFYHGLSMAALGCTPSVWAIDLYLASRHPSAGRANAARRSLRLLRNSDEHVKV